MLPTGYIRVILLRKWISMSEKLVICKRSINLKGGLSFRRLRTEVVSHYLTCNKKVKVQFAHSGVWNVTLKFPTKLRNNRDSAKYQPQ